jgi:hypothetical protein
LDSARDGFQGITLANDTPFQDIGEFEHLLDFIFDHAPDRNAGPISDDAGDGISIDAWEISGASPWNCLSFSCRFLKSFKKLVPLFWAEGILGLAGFISLGAASIVEPAARSLPRSSRTFSTIFFSSFQ